MIDSMDLSDFSITVILYFPVIRVGIYILIRRLRRLRSHHLIPQNPVKFHKCHLIVRIHKDTADTANQHSQQIPADKGQFQHKCIKLIASHHLFAEPERLEMCIRDRCGNSTKVLMLVEGKTLISFCTLAEQDDVRDASLTPWIGFVYTFPEFRGHRYLGKLLEYAKNVAASEGATHIYISTDHMGLYEKYGYSFYKPVSYTHLDVYKRQICNRIFFSSSSAASSAITDNPSSRGIAARSRRDI